MTKEEQEELVYEAMELCSEYEYICFKTPKIIQQLKEIKNPSKFEDNTGMHLSDLIDELESIM